MAIMNREELDRLLTATDSYSSEAKQTARKRIREEFDKARQALVEAETLERLLREQTEAKVRLQLEVHELQLELKSRPPVQQQGWSVPPSTGPYVYPNKYPLVTNETDPNAPFAQPFEHDRALPGARDKDIQRANGNVA